MHRVLPLLTLLFLSMAISTPANADDDACQIASSGDTSLEHPLDKWLAGFIVDQLDAGGWSCQCRLRTDAPEPEPEPETQGIEVSFWPNDFKEEDQHRFHVENESDQTVKVVIKVSERDSGQSHGRLEFSIPAKKERKIDATYFFDDPNTVYFLVTSAEIIIPENATAETPEGPLVIISRSNIYGSNPAEDRPDNRASGSFNCWADFCNRNKGGAGGRPGTVY